MPNDKTEQQEPQVISLTELNTRLAAISQQRNDALDQIAIMNGNMAVQVEKFNALATKYNELEKKHDALTNKKRARKAPAKKGK
jgi:hypothetical protein